MIAGVLFDLDGTLLDIDIDRFLGDYFGALGPVVAEVLGAESAETGLRAIMDGTSAMIAPHPGRTNRTVFNERFRELTGVDLDLEEYALPFERFYHEVFPQLRRALGPRDGAREAVETALDLGMSVAIATNPIFPLSAVAERMRWAGVDDLAVQVVTSYENMHATKPLTAYYVQTAEMMGVPAGRCLMVGDDRVLDMSAADAGMRTFYVGPAPIPPGDFSGNLRDLAALLPRLAADES